MLELSLAIGRSGESAQSAGKSSEEAVKEGVNQMKIATSEVVVPMLSLHKFG
jgi:hypothetical protein